jgi:DNA-directed RNA polymerase subunit beta'
VLAEDLIDEHEVTIAHSGDYVTNELMDIINDAHIDEVRVRSPLTCHTVSGVCQKCYGFDFATRDVVDVGTPVGILAAQSMGELATQLTLNTFHAGGVAGGSEEGLASGIERVKQLFEIRTPKKAALVSPFDGTIHFNEGKKPSLTVKSEYQRVPYLSKSGYEIVGKKGDLLKKGGVYAIKGRSKLKVKEGGVLLEVSKDQIILGVTKEYTKPLTGLPLLKKEGDNVYKGEKINKGPLDIRDYKDIVGDLEAQQYIIKETEKVYASQGGGVNPKHIEVIVKQMFSKVFIEDSGNSSFVPGDRVKYEDFVQTNKDLIATGKQPAE